MSSNFQCMLHKRLNDFACFEITLIQVLRRFVHHSGRCAFVVEHDLLSAAHLADRVVSFSGVPGSEAVASSPRSAEEGGMDGFLRELGVTFRRDPANGRYGIVYIRIFLFF